MYYDNQIAFKIIIFSHANVPTVTKLDLRGELFSIFQTYKFSTVAYIKDQGGQWRTIGETYSDDVKLHARSTGLGH